MTEILQKPYSFVFLQNEDGTISGEIIEFPGCFSQGETIGEAMDNLMNAAESWIEATQEQGLPVPEPFVTQDFGGKVALRLPKSLHKQAVRFAEMDGVSLNQFLVDAIAEKVGAMNLYQHLTNSLSLNIATTAKSVEYVPIVVQSSATQTKTSIIPERAMNEKSNSILEPINA